MRFLHTSDWHVGRSLHGTDLLAEQEAVLSRLADVVRAERVDVVLVAGDVYDRAVPSADATGVLDRVLSRLRAAGATVVLTPATTTRPGGWASPPGCWPCPACTSGPPRPRWTSRSCWPTSTVRSPSTGCRSSSPRSPATSWAPTWPAPTRPCCRRRWTRCGPTCTSARAPAR
ncbi:exonuclease SbcCD subunit D [Klenkia terrae]|uniref:metallophosphoesterase family protein n=1 Tax=Klenkia terrae TaxID=1052259 RepID=UPI00360B5DB4